MQKGVVRKRRPAQVSEYGKQLREKQDLKALYNVQERQFRRYVEETLQKSSVGNAEEELFGRLEQRLDNVVFRMGLADTRKQARQLVSHGHIQVNERPVRVASYRIKTGEKVRVRPNSLEHTFFKNRKLVLAKYQAPSWLALHPETMEAEIKGVPVLQEAGMTVQIPLVFEFYSR
jgi:small subunit ribosomal protein S4